MSKEIKIVLIIICVAIAAGLGAILWRRHQAAVANSVINHLRCTEPAKDQYALMVVTNMGGKNESRPDILAHQPIPEQHAVVRYDATVKQVNDDFSVTLVVSNTNRRVVLAGIAPDPKLTWRNVDKPWTVLAVMKDRLVPGRKAGIEIVENAKSPEGYDYGYLTIAFGPNFEKPYDYNAHLVWMGYARVDSQAGYLSHKSERLRQIEDYARSERKGIWEK